MAIDALSGYTSAASLAPQSQANDALGKEDFMKLLITQMSNQDPLSPVDNSEFIAQLAQFSSLEAMTAVRDSVDTLSLLQSAATNAQVASLVGRHINVRGGAFTLQHDTSVELGFTLGAAAEKVEVTIYDEDGNKVRTLSLGPQEVGEGTFEFDGHDDDGNLLPEGDYTFKLAAFDRDDMPVNSITTVQGRVTGVSFANGYPELIIGEQRFPLGAVTEITE